MSDEHGIEIQRMFDAISRRYDLLNRLLSFGMDIRWRRKAVNLLGDMRGKTMVDLCCGSGDFLMIFRKKYTGDIRLVGIDFARNMLTLAHQRFDRKGCERPWLCRADAIRLPLPDQSADAVTIGFGIRNIADKAGALQEIHRALRPGGQLIIVEPAIPASRPARFLFSFYFRRIMPVIGGLISGDRPAYKYLHDSVATFPEPGRFLDMMAAAGFGDVRALPQSFGAAMIYQAKR